MVNCILIADSGSTKTDWILTIARNSILEVETMGINPVRDSRDAIFDTIKYYLAARLPKEYIVRETLRRVQTPQAYKLGKLYWAYKKAFEEEIGIYGSSYVNTMMVDLGETLYFASGSDKNIKITTVDDIELFKTLISANKTPWLK